MSKELKGYLHLYLGCECEVGNKTGKITAVQSKPFVQAIFRDNEDSRMGHFVNIENIKLILRPLSDMTEDEALYISQFIAASHLSDNGKIHSVKELFDSNGFYNKITNLSGNQWNKIITYCRKQQFDMDSLIYEGLAIDKTKLLTNK